MKKHFLFIGLTLVAFGLISWGSTGHRAIGLIAENHLTPKAEQAIKTLLGKESLAEVSTYADEIKSDPDFKYTSPWHYLNLAGGYTYDEFVTAVKAEPSALNVYTVILKCRQDLKNPNKDKRAKIFALKMLVHLVGDCHQPMHISHAEDVGGNKVYVTFLNESTNLHSLWDSGLIEHEGLDYKQIGAKYGNATSQQITKWQSDYVMTWLYESYQISEQLYKEAAENPAFGEAYYQSHIGIIHQRILQGGIRLAGLLNGIYE